MIHVYYDTETGVINSVTQSEYEFDSDIPHIHADSLFNMNHFKVNLQTLSLEEIPVEERSVFMTREQHQEQMLLNNVIIEDVPQ